MSTQPRDQENRHSQEKAFDQSQNGFV
ncbi:hypothetical protein FOXB_15776 [Fusarium oxysporum f. sp. conglutinans Fo5176]|uniref:Uncharacterized protein n=1 Tax=Fusarium oxysporum (strain Fo5176) TaxID=660025 RepID=F9GAU4_FUSOF|nr:hypothetical protein FOXB_15776 [Fusarium oxysporum f. sp. conglutinans Fo5176]